MLKSPDKLDRRSFWIGAIPIAAGHFVAIDAVIDLDGRRKIRSMGSHGHGGHPCTRSGTRGENQTFGALRRQALDRVETGRLGRR